MTDLPAIFQTTTASGVRIYRIPTEVFPGFIGYCYVLLGAGVPTLVDTGSGYGKSAAHILAGINALHDAYGERLQVHDLERIIITHGHVDHFGGLASLLHAMGDARIGIHPLDRRVLTNYEERVIVATKNLTLYLERAGVSETLMPPLLNMYGFSKQHVRSVGVDFMFDEGDVIDGMAFYHVPGHCSGQVAIRIDDVLLSADHVLARTSPHVAAESITHYTGLGHYRDSLRKIRQLEGIRLTLGGHEEPVEDLHGRIDAMQTRIDQKLERVLDTIRAAGEPLSISEISKRVYQERQGFDILLALQEAGAYVEYLYDRGYLGIDNLEEFEEVANATLYYNVL